MRILIDQDLSPRLVSRLADMFAEVRHASTLGLGSAGDVESWQFARERGMTILTRDSDFADPVSLRGAPPKVIWIRLGNCTTSTIADVLVARHDAINAWHDGEDELLTVE